MFVCFQHASRTHARTHSPLQYHLTSRSTLRHCHAQAQHDSTFKLCFEAFGKKPSRNRQQELLKVCTPFSMPWTPLGLRVSHFSNASPFVSLRSQRFGVLPWKGDANMDDPDQVFYSVEDYGPVKTPEPRMCFFVEHVAEGGRRLVTEYNLKDRNMLGTTSMDAEMSLIMANLAQVRPAARVVARWLWAVFLSGGYERWL